MVTCIVLTAGESRRFGSPKALAPIGGQTALGRILHTLLATSIDEIIVVVGAQADMIKPYVFNHTKLRLVHNKDYKFGQTSSFQAGVRAAHEEARGLMLLPVDCPLVKPETIEELRCFFNERNPGILVPVYKGQRGHPPVFNSALKKDILEFPSEKGINTFFVGHAPVVVDVDDPGILKTFNTPAEFSRIQCK